MFFKDPHTKTDIKNVVVLSIYDNKMSTYSLSNGKHTTLGKPTYNKSNFVASYLSSKEILTTTVQISRGIPEQDIYDILYLKAQEEFNLDQALNYIISFDEVRYAEEKRIFNLFIVQKELLNDIFLDIKSTTKYFDLIVPAPLIYKPLYKESILGDDLSHCFIHFDKECSFISFYKDGNLLYSKTLDFSQNDIFDTYCQKTDTDFKKNDFFEIGVLKDPEKQEILNTILLEVYSSVDTIINYVKRAYEIEVLDSIFVNNDNALMIDLYKIFEKNAEIKVSNFNFSNKNEEDKRNDTSISDLLFLQSVEILENNDIFTGNLTIFPRPPSFLKRASGQFLASLFVAIVISLLYPMYYIVGSYIGGIKIQELESSVNKSHIEVEKYAKIISSKKHQLSILDKEVNEMSKHYRDKTKTLMTIYNQKIYYRLKTSIFFALSDKLDEFNVKVERIKSKGDKIWLYLVAPLDRSFTELIKGISNDESKGIGKINIVEIKKEPSEKYYRGILEVEFNENIRR